MGKQKSYRTKEERQKHTLSKKRGRCVEIYSMKKARDVHPDEDVLIRVATESEGCRDMNDVEAVLMEKSLVGTFVAVRRAGEIIERVAQTVVTTIIRKSDVKTEEVPLEQDDNSRRESIEAGSGEDNQQVGENGNQQEQVLC